MGELDLSTVAVLRASLAGRTRAGDELVIDLSGLSFIDSTGLHLLLSMRSQATGDGAALRLVVNDQVLSVLEVSGLADLFDLERRAPPATIPEATAPSAAASVSAVAPVGVA